MCCMLPGRGLAAVPTYIQKSPRQSLARHVSGKRPDKCPSKERKKREHACLPTCSPLSPKTLDTHQSLNPGVPSSGSAFRASRPFRYGAYLPGLAVFLRRGSRETGGRDWGLTSFSVCTYVCVW
jgi:hypothetical protein